MNSINPTGGIVNIYKPENMTSFAVVMAARKAFRTRKVGHIGTLDPFAKGVLPVCIGKATGVARYMDEYDKTYRVIIVFGERTDTQDRTGTVISRNYPSSSDLRRLRETDFAELRSALEDIQGESYQLTPMYSARKVNGTPLYKLARNGIDVERERKKINIFSADMIDAAADDNGFRATVDIRCSKGTYIRTICDDLGIKLSFYAYAKELTRLASGPFTVEETVSLDELASGSDLYSLFGVAKGFYSTDHALTGMGRVSLDAERVKKLMQGQSVIIPDMSVEPRLSVYKSSGQWVGVAKSIDESRFEYRAERIFADVK